MTIDLISTAGRKSLLIFAAFGSLLFAVGAPGRAESGNVADEALVAAKAWIAQIDAGNYAGSYAAGCRDFHNRVTEDKWVMVLQTFRPSYGKVISRREASHIYKEDGIKGLDGECMIIIYNTSFSRLQNGYEQVILKLEDGQWRGAGYEAGPKPSDQPVSNNEPDVQTQVNTVKTIHPSQ
jgi:hypothetical protein